MQTMIFDAGLDEALLPGTKDLPAFVDRSVRQHRIRGNPANWSPCFLDRTIFDPARHSSDMLDDCVGQIDTLRPEMFELVTHPIGGGRIVVAPEDFISMAEAGDRIVHAADE